MRYMIAPSLLAADFARLGDEADAVLAGGADMLHLDVMDNHFVPNLTVGPMVCGALRQYGIQAPIDVHLMTQPVDNLITAFAKAGASIITFHPEASKDVAKSLQLIHDSGCHAGLALNPGTPLKHIEDYWDKVDLLLMMSVNPGFGGQAFIPATLDKLMEAKKIIDQQSHPIRLSIDGGIKVENILAAANAGADTFVAGSAIFSRPNYAEVIAAMRQQLAQATNA